ncbi:Uncharacterized protein TCM_010289 [Theobroma cacao]|uniref:Uncharacterized protein n=1 Tax=Theobroma cacao TaxID=3641 RepID=A0A061E700_THECC|nr:Uncharacterized protein TCM_010289 [Theobroma cacao]
MKLLEKKETIIFRNKFVLDKLTNIFLNQLDMIGIVYVQKHLLIKELVNKVLKNSTYVKILSTVGVTQDEVVLYIEVIPTVKIVPDAGVVTDDAEATPNVEVVPNVGTITDDVEATLANLCAFSFLMQQHRDFSNAFRTHVTNTE